MSNRTANKNQQPEVVEPVAETTTPEPEVSVPAPVAIVPRQKHIVKNQEFNRRDKEILEFHVYAPEGSKIEDFDKPECWAHIAHKMENLSEITVQEKAGRWVALLQVVSCATTGAITTVLWHKETDTSEWANNDEYEVKWINHQDKFGVLRKADKIWVAKNLPTSSDAAIVMAGEMKALRGR